MCSSDLFYAVKDTKTPMLNSFIGIALNIILNLIFVKQMGVSGLTLATSISAAITAALMLASINKKLKGIEIGKTLQTIGKILLASLVMSGVIYLLNMYSIIAFGAGSLGSIISLLLCFVAGTTVYFTCIYLLKVEEFQWLISSLKGKFNRERAV